MNITDRAEFRYRIIYESLSRFSGNLGKCNSFKTVANCLHTDLKYIVDFSMMRFLFYQHNNFINYTLTPAGCNYHRDECKWIFPEEKTLYEKGVPVNKMISLGKEEITGQKELNSGKNEMQYSGWNFVLGADSGIIISLINKENKSLLQSDITIIKLVVENLYSRLLSLKLIEELDAKKNELQKALIELKTIHTKVSTIAARQDLIIKERTAELKESNSKLLQLSKLNTHNLREPLSRILGLLYLLEQYSPGISIQEYLPMLRQSSADLDAAIYNTVTFIDDQILKLKDYEM